MDRTILELYEIVLNNFENERDSLYICNCAEYILTIEDFEKFKKHFDTQRPSETQYIKFFKHKNYITTNGAWFSYEFSERVAQFNSESFKIRIKLLKAIIKKLKNDIN